MDYFNEGPESEGVSADEFHGGAGSDVVDYSIRTKAVTADADGKRADDGLKGEGDTIASDVEAVYGGAGGDTSRAVPGPTLSTAVTATTSFTGSAVMNPRRRERQTIIRPAGTATMSCRATSAPTSRTAGLMSTWSATRSVW